MTQAAIDDQTIDETTIDDPIIKLQGVGKIYDGTEIPAVADLDLEIQRGEILVLVGPSGCGKSTTLRLSNRMIEPTSGRIFFEGDDVTDVDADKLRRQIGYVIQQIGLFPHQTIAQNIGTVPKLLGWNKNDISERVDYLLDVVGMDPSIFADRYPRELSGGQAQRIGVARALGADPKVLLMDEPFGAIDPITRDRLQNEFLRLQADLQKTIVFVTHDIDEAIKMGDRIAILAERSRVAQHDTPERILSFPVDDFVADFIGSGATLKGLNFERVRDVKFNESFPVVVVTDSVETARLALQQSDEKWLLVVDSDRRPHSWAKSEHLAQAGDLASIGVKVTSTVPPHATLHDALEEMLTSNAGQTVVIDDDGRYQGILDIEQLTEVLRRMRASAKKHYDEKVAS